ncbi:MAG: histidine phosphatase family protein [Leptospira sp.]|nr:histidine phosphatase family protein [Leptospira sp.]
MKKIFLMRHAKSDWNADFRTDHERPLSDRGKGNAKSLRKFLSARDFHPDIAYVSDSKRTIQTFKLAVRESWIAGKIVYSEKIYEAPVEELIQIVQGTDDRHSSILIVGHNPGMELLSGYLLNLVNQQIFVKFSTSAFASFDCDIGNWKNLQEGCAKLGLFLTKGKVSF